MIAADPSAQSPALERDPPLTLFGLALVFDFVSVPILSPSHGAGRTTKVFLGQTTEQFHRLVHQLSHVTRLVFTGATLPAAFHV